MGSKTLKTGDFTLLGYSDSGEPEQVAKVQVPRTKKYVLEDGEPYAILLARSEVHEVSANSTETVTLNDDVPRVDFIPDVTDGVYPEDANIVAYYSNVAKDDVGGQVQDTTDVQFTGTFTSDNDFVSEVEVENTTGDALDVEFWCVTRRGYVEVQKRTHGKGQTQDDIERNTAIKHAFSSPYNPDSDRQVVYSGNRGLEAVFPPKFRLDLIYYGDSNQETVNPAGGEYKTEAPNNRIELPVRSSTVPKGERQDLRARVTADMRT